MPTFASLRASTPPRVYARTRRRVVPSDAHANVPPFFKNATAYPACIATPR
jgi:hypothetical protein